MTEPPPIRAVAGGVALAVRVTPRAPRVVVGGVKEGRVLLRVTAPPVDHAANAAVIEALAEAFAVPRRDVRITAGLTSRNKTVEIAGVTPAMAARVLE